MSEYPKYVLALDTRTRTFGTWNFAVALRGRSTGWGRRKDGTPGRPRRTFVGHCRVNPNGGRRYVKLNVTRGPAREEVWARALWRGQARSRAFDPA